MDTIVDRVRVVSGMSGNNLVLSILAAIIIGAAIAFVGMVLGERRKT